jgi:hypothetical protein
MAIIPGRYRVSGGAKVTRDQIEAIIATYKQNDYDIPKFVLFIETAIKYGYRVRLYDAQTTVSKYVYVYHKKKSFKVRFSNHKPNYHREKEKDCDFFVGITHLGVTSTKDAWYAMRKHLGRTGKEKICP